VLNIKKMMQNLYQLRDEDFAKYHINSDPIEGKIPKQIRGKVIRESLDCGYEEARSLMGMVELPNGVRDIDIVRLAESLGISIKMKKAHNAMEYIYFGTYEEPGIIRLYQDNIRKGEALVKEHNIEELIGINLEEVVLAHEIFHHIEARKKELYVNSFRINLWKLGPYTHRSRLICTGEIAGMAFARKLLNLNFCPNVLDVLFLYPHNQMQAERLYQEIIKLSKKDYE